ncbi:hypothetical protein J5TS2_18560 [Brevibacillus halotolerans]|nr:hypothetical protein J5TS2_18560 [Brevibacillus halotolerans]
MQRCLRNLAKNNVGKAKEWMKETLDVRVGFFCVRRTIYRQNNKVFTLGNIFLIMK